MTNFVRLSIGAMVLNQQSSFGSYELSPSESTNSGLFDTMLSTVFFVMSLWQPQSPTDAILKSGRGSAYAV